MGYNTSATTTTLTARLTPVGRQKLIVTNNNLVTSFSLGDSDANYLAGIPLETGEVPGNGGTIGPYNTSTNSVGTNVGIKNMLLVDNTGTMKKMVEPQSSAVTLTTISNGYVSADTTTTTQNLVSRSNADTDPLVNLFYSFNLPLNSNDDYTFTGLTASQGGFSDTALSGLAQNTIAVIGIDNSVYGEIIDGKSLKIDITTSTSAYTLYSTYQNIGQSSAVLDANISEEAPNTQFLGSNIALLFCDDIQKPNNSSTLSWSTGWGTTKPFSVNAKQTYNLTTNTNLNQYVDKAVGVAYLDKGFVVITDPTIVNDFDLTSTATTIELSSVSTYVVQNITCIANRGEFGTSTNSTFTYADVPRISEIGLYDTDGDLIAIAKTDRHLEKNVNEFLALCVKILL